jgi:uncharacterized protein YpuA (DUF1002 family)
MDEQQLVEALAELGRSTTYPAAPGLASAVQARVAELGPPPQPSWLQRLWGLRGYFGISLLGVVLLAGLVLFGRGYQPPPVPPPPRVVVLGGDLTEAEREEILAGFVSNGMDGLMEITSVSRPELFATLQSAGIPVDAGDGAISSVAVACNEPPESVRVTTEHISRLGSQDYAAMLLIAGIQQATASISAPSERPVTGETALVGMLRGAAWCQPAGELDARRIQLTYAYLALTMRLSDDLGEFGPASTLMSATTQAVAGQSDMPVSAIATHVEETLRQLGLTLRPARQTELVGFFEMLAELDYGPFAHGYEIQRPQPNEALLVPTGVSLDRRERGGEEVDRIPS